MASRSAICLVGAYPRFKVRACGLTHAWEASGSSSTLATTELYEPASHAGLSQSLLHHTNDRKNNSCSPCYEYECAPE